MKAKSIVAGIIIASIIFTGFTFLSPGDDKGKGNFYSTSLHATNRGIGFIYSKEHGGLERLTGITAEDLGCYKSKCHATTCDDCHLKEANGLKLYTSDTATLYSNCKRCHGDIAKDNPDVHFSRGMKCMDCHTSKEIHGDGKSPNSYLEPGFFEVSCEKCHVTLVKNKSHTIHGNKLACNACHGSEYATCLNCHIDNRLKEKKDRQVMIQNSTFLINHNGKVTLGNMISYVYQNKTMITFAKSFGHSIKKQGRTCNECHRTKIIEAISEKTFNLTWWENDSLKNSTGVIPVLEGYDWNLVYLNYENGKWIPFIPSADPLLNYSGFCSPISQEQFDKLK
jgi:hypothetical protein